MISNIAFEIPAELLARVASGEVIRYGTILKDVGTGQIIRHMQETGVAQSVLSSLTAGPFAPFSIAANVINAGSGIYTGIKINQLQVMVQMLQSLQVATMGISLAGVGVSVAGFYYMHKRIKTLEGSIGQLGAEIRAGFESLDRRDLRKQLHLTKSLLQRAQQAQALSDPRAEYSEVAAGLADQAAYFEGEVAFMVKAQGPINKDDFWRLTQMLMLCNGVRIDCRIRTNELRHALTVSEAISSEYNHLFSHLTPTSFGPAVNEGLAMVRILRDASDAADSKPYLIDYLRTQRIQGIDYIEAIEQEKTSPYLLLKTGRD